MDWKEYEEVVKKFIMLLARKGVKLHVMEILAKLRVNQEWNIKLMF